MELSSICVSFPGVAARVRDDESEALFEDDKMEDIRRTCQEYPQHRIGGTRADGGPAVGAGVRAAGGPRMGLCVGAGSS